MPTIPYVRATHVDGNSFTAAKANTLEAGVNDVSYAPAVRVTHNANQSITSATLTALAFNTERFDQAGNATDTMHDTVTNNSRLTCRYAGVYLIGGSIAWASAPNNTALLVVRLNGTTQVGRLGVTDGSDLQMSMSTLYALAVNDYVELMVQQDSGAAINITTTGNYSPEFWMVRVA